MIKSNNKIYIGSSRRGYLSEEMNMIMGKVYMKWQIQQLKAPDQELLEFIY